MAATFETLGATTADSGGTAVTTGAASKGSWIEISASTTNAAKLVYFISTVRQGDVYRFDVGTGANPSEVVVIPDLHMDGTAAQHRGISAVPSTPFRLDIASGTRITVRGLAASARTLDVEVIICDTSLPIITSPTIAAYGINSGGTGKLTTVDPGGTINTKPTTYTQLTASCSATAQHCYFQFGLQGNTAMTAADFLVDIATGAVSSEVDRIANIHLYGSADNEALWPRTIGPFPADIFQSQRVSARAQCSINDATDRLIGVAMIVVSGTAV